LKTSLIGTIAAGVAFLGAAGESEAAFPGANGKIAFDGAPTCPSVFNCPLHSLFTVEPDGRAYTQLLTEEASDPAWSPDGRKIAFTALDYTLRSFYIAVVNSDGTGRRSLDPPRLPVTHDAQPSWSPDGKKIAFIRFVREGYFGQFEIFVMTADGQDATRLTHADGDAGILGSTEPAWSPDGSRIAFTRTVGSDTAITVEEVFVMNADGTGAVRLTHSDTGVALPFAGSPTWSPNGNRIAFHTFRPGGADIYTMKPDGSDVTPAVTTVGPDLYPAWSPDGTKLAYAENRAELGGYEIVAAGVDGSNPTRLTFTDESTFHPDWQPLNRPPECLAARATPAVLWPPNSKFVTVSLGGATDPDGDDVTISATGVTSDEPVNGDFVLGPGANQVRLRAERNGFGDGRAYTIAFEASDGEGGKCVGSATVSVPHSR
jgi:Tol biopolymer transport system component